MAFESNGLKVDFVKTNVIVSGCIIKDDLSKSKVGPCRILRVKANSVLCVHCVVSGSSVDVPE